MKSQKVNGLHGVKNIGPTITKRLQEIGARSLADLKIGAANAYTKLKEKTLRKYFPFVTTCIVLKVHC